MDPISLIVTAVAAGAASALKPTAERVVIDAYTSLRTIIRDRYQRAGTSIDKLEEAPESSARKDLLAEDLAETNALEDVELVTLARQLLDAVSRHAPEAAEAAAIDLEDIRAGANVDIQGVIAEGTAIRMRRSTIEKDLIIRDVESRQRGAPGS